MSKKQGDLIIARIEDPLRRCVEFRCNHVRVLRSYCELISYEAPPQVTLREAFDECVRVRTAGIPVNSAASIGLSMKYRKRV